MSENSIPFKFITVGDLENPTLIPVGKYSGFVEAAKFAEMPDGTRKLWVGVRITGPKQANRYITTLCTLDDTSKAAYKTTALIKACSQHLGGMFIPSDPQMLVGAKLVVDVVHWTPTNGDTTNEIRTFLVSLLDKTPKDVVAMATELGNELSINSKMGEPNF